MKIIKYLVLIISMQAILSCVPSKEIAYFQEIDDAMMNDALINLETKIKVDDLLTINVAALDPEASIPFNLMESPIGGMGRPLSYLVDADGELNFPVLGKIKVAGLTTKELTDTLGEKLSKFIINPVVNIRLINFRVTVLGEVKAPGMYTIPNERISILEAIGMAGDLTIQGKRSSVLLIREQEGKRVKIPINLTSEHLLNSPYYYLAQNDVIYIEPNKAKRNSSAVGANTGVILSSISTLISIIAILTR